MNSETVTGGWDARRAVQTVAVDGAGARWFGSGYLVADDVVLTAAHVLHGARSAAVRFVDGPGSVREVSCDAVFSDARADVAVLRLCRAEPLVASVVFGYPSGPVACDAVGFPRFKLNDDHRAAGPGPGDAGGWYRDSHHAAGTCRPDSNGYAGTLELEVPAPGPDADASHSPWEGMSGAAVFAAGRLIAVVNEHHPRAGLGWLTASRAQRWFELLDRARIAELRELIGLPDAADLLDAVGSAVSPVAVSVQMSLPRDTAVFTGRTADLERLRATLDGSGQPGSGTVLGIHAVDGMAGVGKTAFAVHAAYALADRFPDGRWFVRLHGHTPGTAPADPDQVLAALLTADGVTADQVPADGQARTDLWRTRTAGRRMLLVLDDAADSAQVRPLLPSAPDALVLVTSRRRLTGLADAVPISLDVLDPAEAGALFIRISGRPDLSPDDPHVARLAGLCGHLPLAIGMAASRLRHHRSWTAEDLIEELTAAAGRLTVLAGEDVSVAAAFDLSYRDLNSTQQQLFRAVGASPAVNTEPGAAAAMLALDPPGARRLLQDLEEHHLLDEPSRGRYRMHDLLREHARALADADPQQSRAAVDRLLGHYLEVAAEHWATNREAALFWLRSERANLLACLEHAANHGRDEILTVLTAALTPLLRTDGPRPLAMALHTRALAAAERLGDRSRQAGALNELGSVRRLTGDYAGAAAVLEQALELYRQIGNRLGQAGALIELGRVRNMTGDYAEATVLLEQALELYQQVNDRLGQADALNALGSVRLMTDDYAGAAAVLEQALELYRQIGNRIGQADALNELGGVRNMTGDYAGAAAVVEQALELYQQIGNQSEQAEALNELGSVRRLTGDYAGATAVLEQALDLNQQIANRLGQADALNELGRVRNTLGDYAEATAFLEQALELYQRIGNRLGQANVLNDLGIVRRLTGDYAGATEVHEQALELNQQIGNRLGQADALDGLAESRLHEGAATEADIYFRRALEIYRGLGLAHADQVAARLAGLGLENTDSQN